LVLLAALAAMVAALTATDPLLCEVCRDSNIRISELCHTSHDIGFDGTWSNRFLAT
jgi:hypothetical protein